MVSAIATIPDHVKVLVLIEGMLLEVEEAIGVQEAQEVLCQTPV